MTKTSRTTAAACASALMVLLSVACAGQPTQETKPATETSQAPAQQAAPAQAPAEGAAPAQGEAPAQPAAPAEGQQAPAQQ